jgi:hypothetical protein
MLPGFRLAAALFGLALMASAGEATVHATNIGPVRVLCGGNSSGSQDGPLVTSRFKTPNNLFVSPFDDSTLFVADYGNHVVRRIDLQRSTASQWFGRGAPVDIPGIGTGAGIRGPVDFVSDPNDLRFLFVTAFNGIHRVELETALGTSFSGVGEGYAEGPAASARFYQAHSIVVQSETRELILTDQGNNRIRRVDSLIGFTAHIAGTNPGFQDGVGGLASFNSPTGLEHISPNSAILVADYGNHCLRRLDLTAANVTTLSQCGTAGMLDGAMSQALFNFPLTFNRPDWSTFVYLADSGNNRVRRVDLATGWVVTVVGNGAAVFHEGDQSFEAQVNTPIALAFGCRGGTLTMYVTGYHAILAVDMSNSSGIGTCRPTSINIGPVSLVAGAGTSSGNQDGPAPLAKFAQLQTVLRQRGSDSLLVADQDNGALRRVNFTSNSVSTWISVPQVMHAVYDPNHPDRIIVSREAGFVLVTPSIAQVAFFSGGSAQGYAEGPAAVARFSMPADLIVQAGTRFGILSDVFNRRVRRLNLDDGSANLLAGDGTEASVDGVGSTARFSMPIGLAYLESDPNRIFVADCRGSCIRAMNTGDLSVTRLNPCVPSATMRNGPLRTASFGYPYGMAAVPVRGSGLLLVADQSFHVIRMVDIVNAWVYTVAGTAGEASWAPSNVSSLEAKFLLPTRVAIVASSPSDVVLYVTFHYSVARVGFDAAAFTTTATPTLSRCDSLTRTRGLTRTMTASRTRSDFGSASGTRVRSLSRSRITTTISDSSSSSVLGVEGPNGATHTLPSERTNFETRTVPETHDGERQREEARSPLIRVEASRAVSAVAAVTTAVGGLVGLPVASRPAVAGAAIRLSTCAADRDGPEVPPYEAMPAQVAVLSSAAARTGSAVVSNAALVVLCVAGAYMMCSGSVEDRKSSAEPCVQRGSMSMRASVAHAAMTVPFSYISPALVEFSAMWLSAAASSDAPVPLGAWALAFAVGFGVALSVWGLLARQAWRLGTNEPTFTTSPSSGTRADLRQVNQRSPQPWNIGRRRWRTLVGPLLSATRDMTLPRVRYAFFVETGTGLVFSALSGIRVESLCIAKCVLATLVAVAFLWYLVVVQPWKSRMDHWFGVVFALLQVLTGALLTAAVINGRGRNSDSTPSSWSGTLMDAAECISLATLALLVVQAIVGLADAVREAKCRKAHAGLDNLGQRLLIVPPSPRPAAIVVAHCFTRDQQHTADSIPTNPTRSVQLPSGGTENEPQHELNPGPQTNPLQQRQHLLLVG